MKIVPCEEPEKLAEIAERERIDLLRDGDLGCGGVCQKARRSKNERGSVIVMQSRVMVQGIGYYV